MAKGAQSFTQLHHQSKDGLVSTHGVLLFTGSTLSGTVVKELGIFLCKL